MKMQYYKKSRMIVKRDFRKLEKMYFQDKAIIAGFEDREGQWEMPCEIVDGLRENKHVLVETVVLLS